MPILLKMEYHPQARINNERLYNHLLECVREKPDANKVKADLNIINLRS